MAMSMDIESLGHYYAEQADIEHAHWWNQKRLRKEYHSKNYRNARENKYEGNPTGRPHRMIMGERTLAARGHAG